MLFSPPSLQTQDRTSPPQPQRAQIEEQAAATNRRAKQHIRNLHTWLRQVARDGSLPPSAFKVAYIIGDHINRESGDAWPSTARIAEGCALAQSTVVELVRRLQAAGHLAIEPGRAGRGKSHHYRMVLLS